MSAAMASTPTTNTQANEGGKAAVVVEGPSLLKQLRDRANTQIEQKQQEYERLQKTKELEPKKKKRKFFKNHFRVKKEEAEGLVQKLSRKEKKKAKEELERLQKLSQRELHAHMMINDPNNQFMRKLTLEGSQGLAELQKADIWKSIIAKKQRHQDVNSFMNALTDDEFSEFIQAKDIPMDKL